MKILASLFIFVLSFPILASADSPVTSTPFHSAYEEIAIVELAASKGIINKKIAAFLVDDDQPLDVKAAVINALSWDIDGKENITIFKAHIEKKYAKKFGQIRIDEISDADLMCLGYLTVMDNYFKPDLAIPFLEKAKDKNPKSYTISILLAITKAQKAMDTDWCEVWRLTEQVEYNKKLDRDMRPQATKIIIDYMRLYESSCE